jgi:xylitol oxidase
MEAALAPFGPRPHWGKLSTLPGDTLRARIPRLESFAELAAEWDPTGKFRNPYLDDILT